MKDYIILPIKFSNTPCDHCGKLIALREEDGKLNCVTLADGYSSVTLHLYCYPVWLKKAAIEADLSNPARFPWGKPPC